MEILANLDSKTQELLTSAKPDFDYLTRRKSSRSSNNDALKVISRAQSLILSAGTPPWERLHIRDRVFMATLNPENISESSHIVHLKQMKEGVLIVQGTPSEVPLEQTMNELVDWVENSPIRRIDFPVGERTVSMMLTHPNIEKQVQYKADFPLLKKANDLVIPELAAADYWLLYRTDAFVNPNTGFTQWQAIILNTINNAKFAGTGGVNRRIVRLVEAMVDLGVDHFNNHLQLD